MGKAFLISRILWKLEKIILFIVVILIILSLAGVINPRQIIGDAFINAGSAINQQTYVPVNEQAAKKAETKKDTASKATSASKNEILKDPLKELGKTLKDSIVSGPVEIPESVENLSSALSGSLPAAIENELSQSSWLQQIRT